jgi:hypothetical protein
MSTRLLTLSTAVLAAVALACPAPAGAVSNPAGIDWVELPGLAIARTEITVAQ